jgi:hypothetical protein
VPIFNSLLDSMAVSKQDLTMTISLKKVLAHYTKFYFKKYVENNLSTFVAASYLDVRTKLFGRVEESRRKKYVKLAIDKITSICSNGPNEISILLNNQELTPTQANKATFNTTTSQLHRFGSKQYKN